MESEEQGSMHKQGKKYERSHERHNVHQQGHPLAESAIPIISYKHDGQVHRTWIHNWRLPDDALLPDDLIDAPLIMINDYTRVVEADGREWLGASPAIVYFYPKSWFNVVALLEKEGVRYYCNVISPPIAAVDHVSYVDYDLDVVVASNGTYQVLDRDEFAQHQLLYQYSEKVVEQAELGLTSLLQRVKREQAPFGAERAKHYYRWWREHNQL